MRDPVGVNVLGRVEVTGAGECRPVAGAKARLLLVRLALSPGSVVPREVLIDDLWPDRPPQRPGDVLRVHLSGLRDQLRACGGIDLVNARGGGWALDLPGEAIDHVRFERLVAAGSSALATDDADSAARSFDAALQLWRDRPFVMLSSPDLDLAAARLEQRHEDAVSGLIEAKLRLGRGPELLTLTARRHEENPLDESAAVAHGRALQQAGRCVEALEVTRAALHSLAERGMTATPGLSRLEEQILLHQDAASTGARLPVVVAREHDAVRAAAPASGGELLGRDEELAGTLQLLERHRVVQLVGLGGIGKTRLALGTLAASHDRGVVVPLARLVAADQLPAALARGVGLNDDGVRDVLFRRAAASLRSTPSLVVIDNCEHLADAVASFVARLVDAVADVRVLLTSRVPLMVEHAATVTLLPLPIGDAAHPGPAAQLLADAASLAPTDLLARWDEIERLAYAAGGVPLAIEFAGKGLAAGGAPPPARPAAGPRRASTPTAGPVEHAIEFAVADLPTRVVDGLRGLVTLPDGVTLDLAQRVLRQDAREVRHDLDAARQRGLLVADHGGARLRLRAPEPVRSALQGSTSAEDRSRIEARLRDTVDELGASVIGSWVEPVDREVIALIDDEHQNFLAVLGTGSASTADRVEHIPGIAMAWARTMRIVDAQHLAERELEHVDAGQAERRAELLLALGTASPSLAHRATHVAALDEALVLSRRCGRRDLEHRSMVELAIARGWGGDLAGAAELLEALGRELRPHPWTEATYRVLCALLTGVRGDLRGGCEQLVAVSTVLGEMGSPEQAVGCRFLASSLSRIAGDDDRALEILLGAEQYEVDRFTAYSHSGVSFEIARIAMARRDPATADRLRTALRLLDSFGDHRTALVCRRDLGRWLMHDGDPADGRDLVLAATPVLLAVDERAAAVGLATLAVTQGWATPTQRAQLACAARRLSSGVGAPLGPDEQATIDRAETLLAHTQMAEPLDDAALRGLLATLAS